MKREKGKLGLWMLTTLVAGNMIGSGIFLLPANLASIGSISLLSWCFTAGGAFLLAIVFAKMSVLVPKTGGPYAYAQAGFGDFVGFQTAYNYWVAIWVGNAGIAVAMVGYLAVFWPILHHPLPESLFAIATVWLLTFVNIIGVRSAGAVQLVTTILKFLPIVLVAILGWGYFHPEYLFNNFNVTNHSNFHALSHAATLTLWAFIGLESATVPAASVVNPKRNIPIATLLGTVIAAVVYIASSTAIMGMVPMKILAASTSPFAAAAGVIFGHWGNWVVAAGAAISCFGCLNGWILLQGQVPMAIADDKLFPAIFSKRNSAGVPAWGIAITSLLMSLLLFITARPSLVTQFQLLILIASISSLVPYFYTALAEGVVFSRFTSLDKKTLLHLVVAGLAAVYSFWAILGAGSDILFYFLIIMLSSIPLYVLVYWQKERKKLRG